MCAYSNGARWRIIGEALLMSVNAPGRSRVMARMHGRHCRASEADF
jgi:hypothetical protein